VLPALFGTPDPDSRLVGAAQRGDAAAFDQLVRRHEAALLGYLTARLLSEEAAREVAQECLLGAWRQLGRFNGRARFKTWLFGIATHKATDYIRRCASLPRTVAIEEAEELLRASDEAWGYDPQRLIDRAECELRVRDAVLRLPDSQREILELYYFGDLKLREIASLLKMNLSTLKYQFYQAHRALRPIVSELLEAQPAPSPARRAARSRLP
jgi:RNA polymerase sigma-70 factor (ECF subfamily)